MAGPMGCHVAASGRCLRHLECCGSANSQKIIHLEPIKDKMRFPGHLLTPCPGGRPSRAVRRPMPGRSGRIFVRPWLEDEGPEVL